MLQKKFRIALASAGLTQSQWAKKHGVSRGLITNVLHGKKSKRLTNLILSFIRKEFDNLHFVNTNKSLDKVA